MRKIIPWSLKRTFELENTEESPYYFTIMSHGRKKNTAASLKSQWTSMIVQSFVNWLVYTFSLYWKALWKKDHMGLYRDDGLMILRNTNSQQTDKIWKKIISIFESINFKIEITTNLTEANFLDLTLKY